MDIWSKKKRSEVMSLIKSKGNRSTELTLLRLLKKNAITKWRRGYKLFGNPDFVFVKHKICIFVDGDFWHGGPNKRKPPKTHKTYWARKIKCNMIRDKFVTHKLRQKGWTVLRIWESVLIKDPKKVIRRVKNAIVNAS